ncbi:ATP-dependent DNA helicase DinG [Gracilibacillus ureilyticus]|uniref:3'-5' exonuclease DinG n=1 Tax=Gracilibacillus ureilyticus TaxID=531814 RepID=A0A1H9LM69_9BACI|nr:ATP-dependent DNA helicase DinG [Gracilibacillus ureilyticus]SER12602.1 ATP-dependent DNA helicase DinG [Gracilibacillus ureilyticus]
MNKYAILDVETTGHAPSKDDRIIEIGIVIVENGEIIQEYNQLINPMKEIPTFISQLTSIKNEDVMDQPVFEEVAGEIMEVLSGTILVAHNINFDLNFVNAELERIGSAKLQPYKIDTVELSRIFFPKAPGYKLNELAHFLYITHDMPHRAISDALVTADLFLLILQKLHSLPNHLLEQLVQLSSKLTSDLSLLLPNQPVLSRDDLLTVNGILLRKLPEKNREVNFEYPSYQEFLDQIYGENGFLAKFYRNYEVREDQLFISETIYDHFQSHKHAIIEAGTGIGKTIAYLIPSVYEALTTGKPIVISTSNVNLQTKLLKEDLQQINHFFNSTIRASVVKGKNHYLSLTKFDAFLHDPAQNSYHHQLVKAMILIWLTETETGDLDEIQFPKKDQYIRQQLVVNNKHEDITWDQYSFYERIKQKVDQSHVIITNHSLISLELKTNETVIPEYSKLILDEAHHFDMIASKYLGESLNYFELIAFLQRLKMELDKNEITEGNDKELLTGIKYEVDSLFRLLFLYVKNASTNERSFNDKGRMQRIWDPAHPSNDTTVIEDAVRRALMEMDKISVRLKDSKGSSNSLIGELVSYMEKMKQLLLVNKGLFVTWLEIEQNGAQNAVYINRELFSATEKLVAKLFEKKQSIILISATLTIGNSFDHFRNRLGIAREEVSCFQLESHFPYDQNVQLMIPSDFPEIKYPNNEDFIYAACETLISLATVLNGKILALFTSYDMLKKAYYVLKESNELTDYIIIGQGISSGSRNRLIKHFQSFSQSILLGTNTYWEGIDIPGEDLSCVVIVKLPFQSPNDPVFEKKSVYYKQIGKNPFMELSLPKAVFQFKQGFGRLIRRETDKGVIFVLDERIITKKYGRYFTESIPDVPIHFESTHKLIKKVNDWF